MRTGRYLCTPGEKKSIMQNAVERIRNTMVQLSFPLDQLHHPSLNLAAHIPSHAHF
jgi:hypothetical protein